MGDARDAGGKKCAGTTRSDAQKRLGIPPAAERTPLTPSNPTNTREHPLTHHPGEVYMSVKKPEGLLGEDSEYVKIENKRSSRAGSR